MTLHRIIAWSACLSLGIASAGVADTLRDDFEDPDFTDAMWEVLQGDWETKDGWWHGLSPAIGDGAFALFS